MNSCPLCLSYNNRLFYRNKLRDYLCCSDCSLVFVPRQFHLSMEKEKAEYDKHENSPEDQAYRNFLNRLVAPMLKFLTVHDKGLDFGCGPGPTLSVMFEEEGIDVVNYDQFYALDRTLLQSTYNFITATEVVEHLRNPGVELLALWDILESGGYFGVMTKLVIDQESFSSWHYKNDPTHISFFTHDTLKHLETTWNATLTVVAPDSFIFRKP
ncbi:class I SAM-dependent methyltransferase [Teredinibacter haidensis]|uniref:class I SAM-dependent methyltransferase n=1 Tax=Teredinibacter haidensis TaxID=2731755 RepID=UPI000948FF2B|nr:class I SAM-dependent methyltransferase [Teredinibacter haidensis]